MSSRSGIISRLTAAAAVLLVLSGLALIAKPTVHLVRRTHAAVSARAAWKSWVASGKERADVGEPAGWLKIPTAGIDTIVLWGDTEYNLQRYPCLSARTADFSEDRVVKVVAAHRDTHFRDLEKVGVGDPVRILLSSRRILEYRVRDIEVIPRELVVERVAAKDGDDWLVLMTCYPFTYTGAAPDRILLWARPEKTRPVVKTNNRPSRFRAGGRPSYLDPSPRPGTGGAYLPLSGPHYPEGRPLSPRGQTRNDGTVRRAFA